MKRKLMAVWLGLTLMSTSFQCVYANEKSDALTNVIIKTKQQLDLPEALTEFDYRESGDEYYLSWHDKEGNQSVQVSCSSNGDILSYNYYEPSEESLPLRIDYENAKNIAEDFLKKVAKPYMRNLKLMDKRGSSKSHYYSLDYEVVQDDIPLLNKQVSVSVDKQTGKVIHFTGISYDSQAKFDSQSPKLTLEEAEKAYLKNIGLQLKYRLRYDENQTKSFLVYIVQNYERKGISAQTGEIVEPYKDELSVYRNYDAKAEADQTNGIITGDLGAGELSDYEKVEVENRKLFLKPEEIVKKAAAFFPVLKDYTIKESYVRKYDKTYKLGIQFSDNTGEFTWAGRLLSDAKTGEVLQYDSGQLKRLQVLDEAEKAKFTKMLEQRKWSQKEGQDFIEKIAPINAKEVKLKDISTPSVDNEIQYFRYERMSNDIPVEGNGIYFSYDPVNKEVTSYNKSWNEVSFKSTNNKMTEAEMVKKIGLKLFYMKTGEHSYSLVYNHEDAGMQFDAYSGKKVNYLGEEIEEEQTTLYSDIKGHPSEQIIKNLYYSGIYIHNNQLRPNEAITLEEMKQLLESFSSEGTERELIQKSGNQYLTREEGIYCLVNLTPYNKLASKSDIFVYPYQDEKVNEAYKGYIATAYALGWLEKGETFNPSEPLTKAEAMVYLYKALDDLEHWY